MTTYICTLGNVSSLYYENEAIKLMDAGAECHVAGQSEMVVCAFNNVRQPYAKEEAKIILQSYPDAVCEWSGYLVASSSGDRGNIINRESSKEEYTSYRKFKFVKGLNIRFPVNKYTIDKKLYNNLSKIMRRYMNGKYLFTITGYASATGSNQYNYMLSLKRAASVKKALESMGVSPASILSVDALGEEALKVRTHREEKKNRIVEIKVYAAN
jgi:outer membrane protein OmpA-like peptidoglycan-associated protein